MRAFMLLFRQPSYDYSNASPEEMRALEKKWQDWIGGIAAQGKSAKNGTRLSTEGKVLKAGGVITDGPFVEMGQLVLREKTVLRKKIFQRCPISVISRIIGL